MPPTVGDRWLAVRVQSLQCVSYGASTVRPRTHCYLQCRHSMQPYLSVCTPYSKLQSTHTVGKCDGALYLSQA
eukprot:2214-Heterococcus_DN1.PRE.6